jgi:DNA-binding transcriptional regulator YdaS (Cro superfamily)
MNTGKPVIWGYGKKTEENMKAEELISALKKKFVISTDKALIDRLGITAATLNSWRNGAFNISPSKLANFIHRTVTKCEKEARLYSIRPIVEYYPVEPGESARGAKWELFEAREQNNQRLIKIKEYLKKSNGIYIFYDSKCKALYVGKAKDKDLWKEMNNAFNQDRETQKLQTVNHPTNHCTGFLLRWAP